MFILCGFLYTLNKVIISNNVNYIDTYIYTMYIYIHTITSYANFRLSLSNAFQFFIAQS